MRVPGGLTMMAADTASICVTSRALAPVTTSDKGRHARPTAGGACCLFSLIRRIAPRRLLRQGRLEHRPIDALPAPSDALQAAKPVFHSVSKNPVLHHA